MRASGTIFYQDEFQTIYHVVWTTIGDVIDFTSTVKQPFCWGKADSGFIRGGILYRRGIVTVTRQVLRPNAAGYEIVAEGSSQYEDDVQMNFPCQDRPTDTFKYHLDYPLVDDDEIVVTDGPRWADLDDTEAVWTNLDVSGNPSATSGDPLEFIDVWG